MSNYNPSLKVIDNRYMIITQNAYGQPKKTTIIDTLVKMIESVPSGSKNRVRVSAYSYKTDKVGNITPFYSALLRAKKKNRNVRIIFNRKLRKDSDVRAFQKKMGDSKKDDCIIFNKIGSVNNHNKFVLFAKVKFPGEDFYRTNVVAQTSCNFKGTTRSNDLILIEDKTIYNAYYKYWLALKKSSGSSYDVDKVSKGKGVKCYFFPKKSGDTILEILDNINIKKTAKIRVLQSQFEDDRGFRIAQKIVAIAKEPKCTVEIILTKYTKSQGDTKTSSGGYLDKRIEKLLKKAKGVKLSIYENGKHTNHSKVLMIDAKDYCGSSQKLVWTGSHNFNQNSLTNNDEALIKIKSKGVYEYYEQYFTRLQKDGPFEHNK